MQFLLSGYYGFGNLGDEALARVIVSELRRRYPYAGVDILSAHPELTAHELGVRSTPRAQFGAVREAIGRADVVLSGGGGLLQNATSLRSLLYYAGILRAANKARRKSMIFAQSIGPLDFFGKRVVQQWCKGTSRATVRDERSKQLLSSLVHDLPIERTADPVFLYDDEATIDLTAHGVDTSAPLVLVAVRKSPGFQNAARAIARAVDRLANVHHAHVAFLPLGGLEDAQSATTLIRKCKSSPVLLPLTDIGTACALIRGAFAVIGMRLHALIFAIRYGVPFLAVAYDPKVSALCDDIAYPLPALWQSDAPRSFVERDVDALVDRLWNERETLATSVRSHAQEMRRLAERNFEVLDELVRA
ncbi:MAG: polysaccharide pyruvyl transferase CsaB [Candidatus Eremiobacteraeota bacterium]|nr:polysaccharide pyruvyl transferase CsaB [Candidatus Eremiobacteraeota bacterium]